jgi:hypothetical protein
VAFKRLLSRAGFAVSAIALLLLAACPHPVFQEPAVKAIKAEAMALMAAPPSEVRADLPNELGTVPKSRWPRVIAGLNPEWVTVDSDGVDIVTTPYFDGGWGYYIPRDERKQPWPERHSHLGHGVYWYHPY